MGKLLKILLYILIIIVIYILGVGFYKGTINSDTTLGQAATDVTDDTRQIVKDGYDATKESIGKGYAKAEKALSGNSKEQPQMPVNQPQASENMNTGSMPSGNAAMNNSGMNNGMNNEEGGFMPE